MSKLFKRKGFRLASVAYFLSLGTLAVALFAWFSTSSTFSWFASNKTVNGTGMAVKVKTDENVNIEMHVYKYVETAAGSGEYAVQKDPPSIAMSRYDRVFQEDNDYAPILLQLKLTGGFYEDNSPLPLVIHHDGNCDKTVIKDSSGTTHTITDDDPTYHLSSYISSVISVKAMVYNDAISGNGNWSSEAENVFKTMESSFEKKETSPQYKTRFFVSETPPETGAATKTDINFSDGDTTEENLLYKATEVDGVSTCMVYVWINYDTSTAIYSDGTNYNGLINCYIDQMQNSTSLGVNVSYPIKSDITELSIIKSDLNSTDSTESTTEN